MGRMDWEGVREEGEEARGAGRGVVLRSAVWRHRVLGKTHTHTITSVAGLNCLLRQSAEDTAGPVVVSYFEATGQGCHQEFVTCTSKDIGGAEQE